MLELCNVRLLRLVGNGSGGSKGRRILRARVLALPVVVSVVRVLLGLVGLGLRLWAGRGRAILAGSDGLLGWLLEGLLGWGGRWCTTVELSVVMEPWRELGCVERARR